MLALSQLDIDPGESYSFTVARDKFVATFVKSKSDGNIVFKRRDTASRYESGWKRTNFSAVR
ncbi:hypothetical protein FHT72_002988 [Rhizobium sp. BK077]|nr:hypothetical protein [Rhizobium sp. BK112]MBB3368501.1 hypothetical protein [Rhizobium sp. BK077]MBB4177233.1 hypothetical protein [Rhizobium sp. BK109]